MGCGASSPVTEVKADGPRKKEPDNVGVGTHQVPPVDPSPAATHKSKDNNIKPKAQESFVTETTVTKAATKHGGRLIEDVYDLGKELGRGQFSRVYLGVNKEDHKEYAIKAIDKHNKSFNETVLDAEVSILLSVDHPNIIKLYEVFDSSHSFYMVLEFVTGGELFDHIVARGHYSENDAACITKQILSALKYLHAKNIIHRDLKPENLLCIDDGDSVGVVKIADFGLSVVKTRDMVLETSCGTPGYVAPEVLQPPKDHTGYTNEVDLWSVGVILYILLCGFPPFYHENMQKLFQSIVKGRYTFPSPEWDHVSDEAKDLIRHLLVVNPQYRYNTDQALAHTWIVRENSKENRAEIVQSMKKWNATRRLKGAVHAVMLMQGSLGLSSTSLSRSPSTQDVEGTASASAPRKGSTSGIAISPSGAVSPAARSPRGNVLEVPS